MAEVRLLKLTGNNRSQHDPATDSVTFVDVTANIIAGDLDLKSKDGKSWWRFIEQRGHIAVINMNNGEEFELPLRRAETRSGGLKFAKCNRCGDRSERKKSRCMACGKKQKVKP